MSEEEKDLRFEDTEARDRAEEPENPQGADKRAPDREQGESVPGVGPGGAGEGAGAGGGGDVGGGGVSDGGGSTGDAGGASQGGGTGN